VLPEEGEGGELVPYSSLQECNIWFENGELRHTLLFACFIPPSAPAKKKKHHPPTPFHLLLNLCLGSGLSAPTAGSWLLQALVLTGRSAGKRFLSVDAFVKGGWVGWGEGWGGGCCTLMTTSARGPVNQPEGDKCFFSSSRGELLGFMRQRG